MTGHEYPTLSVAAILAESAVRHPDRVAVIGAGGAGAERIGYAVLWQQALAYAGALRDRGIGYRDTVAVLIPNLPDFPRVYYAILLLGAIVVPIHPLLRAAEIEHVLRDSGARLLVVDAGRGEDARRAAAQAGVPVVSVGAAAASNPGAARLEDEAAGAAPATGYRPMHPLDPATILYTSGTTGSPKGAVSSHLSLVEQVHVALLDSFDVSKDDVFCGTLPLFHTFGQSNVMNTAFRRGASVLLIPRFEADAVLEAMVRNRVTIFAGVPTMFVGLIEAARRSPKRPPLRYAISGGAPLVVAVLERFAETFQAPVHEGYGLTETSPTATFNHYGRPTRPGSAGTAIWGVDVRVAATEPADRVELLPDGELGEVVIRGHNLFLGYHDNPEASEAAVIDGWFRTGDLGVLQSDGYLTIVDRTKDMILRNGYNVYPRELEEVLARFPGVRSVAVFGVPDDRHGQEVVAAVVPDGDLDAANLLAWVREQIAAHKYPRRIEIVDELPLGPSGKVLKRALVERFGPG